VARRPRRPRGSNPSALATSLAPADRGSAASAPSVQDEVRSAVPTRSAAGAARVRRAAIALFRERGYHGATMRALAGRLRVEAPSLYYHFASKQDILFDILDRTVDELLSGLARAIVTSADPEGRLRAGVRFHILFHAHRRAEAFLSHSELRSLTPANFRRIIAKRDRYERVFRDMVAAGVKASVFEVPDLKLAVIAILTMCTGVAAWFSEHGRLDADAIVDCYTEMIVRSVSAAPTAPPQRRPKGTPRAFR
jgi:AcrR family transcriptional regulator